MRWSVRRGGSAGRRGLQLPVCMLGLRGLRGWMVRGVDEAVFAGVAPGSDGWVMRGAWCLGVAGLGGKRAGLFGWGGGLLLGALRENFFIL